MNDLLLRVECFRTRMYVHLQPQNKNHSPICGDAQERAESVERAYASASISLMQLPSLRSGKGRLADAHPKLQSGPPYQAEFPVTVLSRS